MKCASWSGVALSIALASCGSSPPRPTAPNSEAAVPEPVIEPVEGKGPVVEEIVDAVPAAPAEQAGETCKGKSFDLAALPKECATRQTNHVPESLTASVAVDAPSVAPAGEVGVTVTFTNPTAEVVDVVLSTGCAYLEAQAFKGNARADYVNTTCGFGRGCGSSAYRVALEPGGTLTQRLPYTARVARWGKECVKKETPLPPGKYELRVDSSADFALHDKLAALRVPLVVKR